jgi:hypothetical protein
MTGRDRAALAASLLLSCLPAAAGAHGVQTRILPTGAVAVEFRYTDGTPMALVDAIAYAPGAPGEPASVGRTDAAGRFALFPDQDGDWSVQAHDQDGHIARAILHVAGHHVVPPRRAFPDWLVAISLVVNVIAAARLGRRRAALIGGAA